MNCVNIGLCPAPERNSVLTRWLRLIRSGFLLTTAAASCSHAVSAQDKIGEVDTTLPGVRYELSRIERIPHNRLLVAVRILATAKTPAEGAFLGFQPQVPRNASRDALTSGRFAPRPLSFSSSQMIDQATDLKYPALTPIPVGGKEFLPAEVLGLLRPGQSRAVTLQFAVPKVLAGSEGSPQVVSFLFPNAKGPITRVAIPPLSSSN